MCFCRITTIAIKWGLSKNRLNLLLVVLLLVGLCAGMAFYKINHCYNELSFFDPDDGECFFWTEAAFHFRHAKMVAERKPIPPLDIEIQYPEGLDTARNITPVMEKVAGTLYRLFFQGIPLHVFLVYFTSIFSTLSVLAVFVAGKFLWRSKWSGFISACFYGLVPASFARSMGASFLKENFALPFIFFSFSCFIYCLRKDRPLIATVGSLLLIIAMAAWHLTQFYLLLFIAGFVIVFFFQNKEMLPVRYKYSYLQPF